MSIVSAKREKYYTFPATQLELFNRVADMQASP